MKLRPGQQVVSMVDDTKMVVVRAPAEADVALTCGGAVMGDSAGESAEGAALDPAQQEGTLLGKRYVDEQLGLELLCAKPGQGTVAANGVPLRIKEAKPLPASD